MNNKNKILSISSKKLLFIIVLPFLFLLKLPSYSQNTISPLEYKLAIAENLDNKIEILLKLSEETRNTHSKKALY